MLATHERCLEEIEDIKFSPELNEHILNSWVDNQIVFLERLSNLAKKLKQENDNYENQNSNYELRNGEIRLRDVSNELELSKLIFFIYRWGEYCNRDMYDIQNELLARKRELNDIVYAMKADPSLMPLYEEKRDALNAFMSSL